MMETAMLDNPNFIFTNVLVAIFNGFVCGFNMAILATGNSSVPALTGAMIAVNGAVAIWIAKRTFDRVAHS
jgi:hypothetical protein